MPDTPEGFWPADDEAPTAESARDLAQLTPDLECAVGVSRDDLASLFLLETIKGFGPQKFRELHTAQLRPIDVLLEPDRLPIRGKRADGFRTGLRDLTTKDKATALMRAARQLVKAHEYGATIVTYAHSAYPPSVYASSNPVPALYVRGDVHHLQRHAAVACVGSRNIGPPYAERHREFATHAARRGFSIVAGFALGADTIGHEAARAAHGRTVLVMPCGLDRPFPPENRELFRELQTYDGALVVSEFPFGTAASALTLRKRNRLIVSFARGVLISQSSASGGAMNAYRFGLEQRKPLATFAPDGTERTTGNDTVAQTRADGAGRPSLGEPPEASSRTAPAIFRADEPDTAAWDQWLGSLHSVDAHRADASGVGSPSRADIAVTYAPPQPGPN